MKVITKAKVTCKKVLVRGDLDIPVKNSQVVDDFRLGAMLSTLNFLLENQAKIILMGHLGRPKGKVVEESRLDPVAKSLSKLLDAAVHKINECVGPKVKAAVADLQPGQILLLENLRFDPREEENDEEFARELSQCGEIYVNEAFAVCHRKHASIIGVPRYLPSFAGIQLAKEVKILSEVLQNPARPLVFIIGGAKPETKTPQVFKIAQIADSVLLGGLLMFEEKLEGISNVYFPKDSVRVDDIGPKTIEEFCNFIKDARTIVWNGPMGRFEKKEFEQGTKIIAQAIIESGAKSIVGGGDTIAALQKFGLLDKFSFVSTGGGAMLEYLAEGTLPGIEALECK